MESAGWVGVDLDGTLAVWDEYRGAHHIGAPIPKMVERVKRWLAAGMDVRIVTARVDGGEVALAMGNPNGADFRDVEAIRRHIERWCREHLGAILPVTDRKDYGMLALWDNIAIRVETNTGEIVGPPPMIAEAAGAPLPACACGAPCDMVTGPYPIAPGTSAL